MGRKSLPLRLDEEMYDLLKEVAEAREEPMVEMVRESLRRYLPEAARAMSEALRSRVRRLEALAQRHPDYLDRSLDQAMQAEVRENDPLEDELRVVEAIDEAPGELTAQVLDALA